MKKKISKSPAKNPSKPLVKAPKMWNDRFIFEQIPEFVGEQLPKRNNYHRHCHNHNRKGPEKAENR